MSEFKIIFVQPEYQLNLGYCARVLANFGYSEMNVVKPKVKIGKTAVMYSKHGRHLIEGVKVYSSIEEAVEGCDFVVGTSGVLHRGEAAKEPPFP